MNNPNTSNRIVINLDNSLDDLDDDDITLPSMPVQSVPIIDDNNSRTLAEQSRADNYQRVSDSVSNNDNQSLERQETSQGTSSKEPAEDIALGAPLITPETKRSESLETHAKKLPIAATVPVMPLQEQLSEKPKPTMSQQTAKAEVPQVIEDSQSRTQTEQTAQAEQTKQKGSWFNRMKSGLSKSRKNLAEGMVSILIGGKEIDDELLEEVEDQLLVADIGVNATNRIIKSLTEQTARGDLIYAHSLYKALQTELVDILTPKVAPLIIDSSKKPFVILVVGVNGVGKTTTIGKLAKRLQGEGKSVMLAAGDTFRAAATEQLQIWGERNQIPVIAQGHGSDSASVIFDAMQSAKAKNIDVLIADTAGRLQNKTHLMAELEKVVRVMRKANPSAPHEGMIVLDAGTGQNAINQVELFNKVVPLTGITITKLDGTAKGGVVFNIAETTDVPIRYIGVGESIDDLRAFSPKQFVAALFDTDDKE